MHPIEAMLKNITDLTLEIRRGDWLAVAGPNGCGKSSLLRFLAGPDAPVRGKARLIPELSLSMTAYTATDSAPSPALSNVCEKARE